jgi:hypothetical protein
MKFEMKGIFAKDNGEIVEVTKGDSVEIQTEGETVTGVVEFIDYVECGDISIATKDNKYVSIFLDDITDINKL